MPLAPPQPDTAADPRPDLDRRAYARAVRRLVGLMVAVGVTARVARFLLPCGVWGDEAMLGLNLVTRDYAGLTRQLDDRQVAPILFLWAEKFALDTLGMSEYAARLLPLLAGLAGLLLFWDFARRAVPPTAAVLAVGLMAVSAWPASMPADLKPYSGDLFWSALLLWLAARWHRRPERPWPLAALAAVVPLAVGSSYPVVFVAGGVSVFLLPLAWGGGWKARALFAAYNVALVASFAAVYALVGRAQVDPAAGDTGEFMLDYWRPGFPPDAARDVPLWLLDRHTNRGFAYPVGDNRGASACTTLLFAAGVVWCWRSGYRHLLVACLVPFALNMVAAVMGKYPYTGCGRLSQHLAPAICLLAGAGWAALLGRVAPRLSARLAVVRWVLAALVAFAVGALVLKALKPDRDGITRFAHGIHRELNIVCRPGDRVVLPADQADDYPIRWYLIRLGDRVVRVRPGESLPPGGRVWVMTSHLGASDRAGHDRFIRSLNLPGYTAGHTTWYAFRYMEGRTNPRETRTTCCYAVTCLVPPGEPEPPPITAVP